jgi:hypothetical protein
VVVRLMDVRDAGAGRPDPDDPAELKALLDGDIVRMDLITDRRSPDA